MWWVPLRLCNKIDEVGHGEWERRLLRGRTDSDP